MRPDILNHGYRPGTKLLFKAIRVFSGQPLPDAAKLVFYRPDFYGTRAKAFTHAAMRGPSEWAVADRELMAAYVSKVNDSAFCVGAHTATSAIRVHHASIDKANEFVQPDRIISMADEPDHDGLCEREQAFFLKAIREGIDLSAHWAAARDSLAIVLAAEQSIRTGHAVTL